MPQEISKVLKVVESFQKLGELVKCSICLETVKNPIQVGCVHIFCRECFCEYEEDKMKGKNLVCPICRTTINRRQKHEFLPAVYVAEYVRSVGKSLNDLTKCKVLESPLKQIEDNLVLSKVPNTKKRKSSDLISKTDIKHKTKKNKLVLEDKNLSSTSNVKEKVICNKDVTLKTSRKNKTYGKENVFKNPNVPSKKDAFDLLLESSNIPGQTGLKGKVIRTYPGKTKKKIVQQHQDKILEFKDVENKNRILKWLNDTRNMFDNFVLTQYPDDNDSETGSEVSLDMPSISQVHKRKKTVRNELLQTQNFYSRKLLKVPKREKRATSLDRSVTNQAYTKKRLKRHSIAFDSQDCDEMTIENVESDGEKNPKENNYDFKREWKMLEEETLKSIEKKNLEEKCKSDVTSHENKINSSLASEKSGWDKLKSINKTRRKIRKLDVSQCTPNQAKKITNNVQESKEDLNRPRTRLRKKNSFKEKNNNPVETEITSKNSPPAVSYDLNVLENYFAEKITNFIDSKVNYDMSIGSETSLKENNLNIIKSTSNTLKNNSSNVSANQENINKLSSKSKIVKKSTKLTETVLKSVENLNKVEPKKGTINLIKENKTAPFVVETVAQIHNELNNKITKIETKLKEKKQDFIISEFELEFKGFPSEIKIETEDVIVQTNSLNDEEMCFQPTQPFTDNYENLCPKELQKNVNNLVRRFLDEIDIQKLRKPIVNIDVFEPILHSLKIVFEKLQNNEHVTDLRAISTQTEQNVRECSVQTVTKNTENVLTQTESIKGFYISSNESFRTQNRVKMSVEIQTEVTGCPTCNDLKLDQNKDKNDEFKFTESLDNVNFETQDILSRASGALSQTLNKFTFNRANNDYNSPKTPTNSSVVNKNNTKDLTQSQVSNVSQIKDTTSQLTISAPSVKDSPSGRKNINKVLNVALGENKHKFKRIRTLQSDSESDSENQAKIKKVHDNKYLQENLSINFDSQFDQRNTQKRNKDNVGEVLTGESQPIDYEEFLNKIMKKYDVMPSTPSPKDSTSHQDIMSKCKQLLEEATLLRPQNVQNSVSIKSQNPTQNKTKLSLQTAQEFERDFSSQKSTKPNNNFRDKISQIEENQFSASLFGSTQNSKFLEVNSIKNGNNSKNLSRHDVEKYIKELSREFEESFDMDIDAELENLHKNKNLNNEISPKKINILQNITIINEFENKNNELTDDKHKEDKISEIIDLDSDDIFDDADIIENTPPKKDNRVNLTQNSPLIDEEVLDCLNMTFTPPLEFRDGEDLNDETLKPQSQSVQKPLANKNTKNQNFTDVTNGISSLTPDLLIEPNIVAIKKKLPETSTPNSFDSESPIPLSLSPIKPLSLIDIAKTSKFSPLTVVKSPSSQPKTFPILASTPKQKSILNFVKSDSTISNTSVVSPRAEPTSQRKPCVSCTRLNKDQVIAINSLASKKLIAYSGVFSDAVTHMVVATNSDRSVKDHTMKYVFAVASGIWVVGFEWIEQCLKKNCLVPEEPYEVSDVSRLPGPKTSRLLRTRNLLKQFKIHAAKPFVSTTQKEVEMVITKLGGTVVPRPEGLIERKGLIPLIITEARASQDFELYESWLEAFRTVTVDLEWLSRSVGQYKLENLRPFTLCSEDNISELGYPELLVADVTSESYSSTS